MSLSVRLLVYLAVGFQCAVASAAVTCEQFAAFAYTTQQLRDQGYSLTTVLSEVDKLEAGNKFTAAEIGSIKSMVEEAYKSGGRFPYEVLQTCKDQPRK